MKTIREIIGRREVYSVDPGDSVQDVVEYLCAKRIGAVAVCEGRTVVGVFSERDLMSRVVRKGLDPKKTKVGKVMTQDVYSVTTDRPYAEARSIMLGKNFRHLVVLDKEDRLRGFVSMREVLEEDLSESKGLIQKLNDDYYEQEFQGPRKKDQ